MCEAQCKMLKLLLNNRLQKGNHQTLHKNVFRGLLRFTHFVLNPMLNTQPQFHAVRCFQLEAMLIIWHGSQRQIEYAFNHYRKYLHGCLGAFLMRRKLLTLWWEFDGHILNFIRSQPSAARSASTFDPPTSGGGGGPRSQLTFLCPGGLNKTSGRVCKRPWVQNHRRECCIKIRYNSKTVKKAAFSLST